MLLTGLHEQCNLDYILSKELDDAIINERNYSLIYMKKYEDKNQ